MDEKMTTQAPAGFKSGFQVAYGVWVDGRYGRKLVQSTAQPKPETITKDDGTEEEVMLYDYDADLDRVINRFVTTDEPVTVILVSGIVEPVALKKALGGLL